MTAIYWMQCNKCNEMIESKWMLCNVCNLMKYKRLVSLHYQGMLNPPLLFFMLSPSSLCLLPSPSWQTLPCRQADTALAATNLSSLLNSWRMRLLSHSPTSLLLARPWLTILYLRGVPEEHGGLDWIPGRSPQPSLVISQRLPISTGEDQFEH